MKQYDESFDTTFLICDEKYNGISSTLVRNLLSNGKNIEKYVHANALDKIMELYNENQN